MYPITYKYFLEATILGEGKRQYRGDNLDWVNKKFDEWMKKYGERAIIRIAITDTQDGDKVVREWAPQKQRWRKATSFFIANRRAAAKPL